MAELFAGDLKVAWFAEVAGVAVLVAAAQRQRHDMVDPRRFSRHAPLGTSLAKPVGASQAAQPLALPRSAPQPLDTH